MTREDFQQSIKQLRPQLIGVARRYLTDGEEAEDAVQDVLLRLWKMHERLHPPISSLAAVLTRNVCIDHLRRHQRFTLYDTTAANGIISTESPNYNNEEHERVEHLMAVIDDMPIMQQTLLRLRHMQGMDMKELADLLQMDYAAVRKALSRARIALRDEYLKRQKDEKE